MYNFNYHRPSSVEEAVQLLSGTSEGTLMGGGMTLIPVLKQRLANPSDVVVSTPVMITMKPAESSSVLVAATSIGFWPL
jgi:carbon-monoxide dehydrogenase medium subunit